MKTSSVLAATVLGRVLHLVALVGVSDAALSQVPDLVTDRPDQTESAYTVPKGLWQLEIGALFTHDNDGLVRGELFDFQEDPNEFHNLWDEPDYRSIRDELGLALLDKIMETASPLPRQLGRS